MPRSTSLVWEFFHKSEERKNEKQHFVATCKFCNPPFIINGQPKRMIKHILEQCKNVPEHVKEKLASSVSSASSASTTSTPLPPSQPLLQNIQKISFLKSNTNNQPNKKQKIQSKIDNYADKCSSEEQEEIDNYLARAIFGGGLPLSLVEDEYFIAFCKKLRPAYELSKCNKLSNELLNKTYKNVTENINQHVKEADSVCITSDGWTNL